jgi:hypothetical protein
MTETLAHYGALAKQAQELEPERAAYDELLRTHDFEFEYSDDQRVWRRGHYERQALLALREKLDPSGAIWNRLAPASHRVQERRQ